MLDKNLIAVINDLGGAVKGWEDKTISSEKEFISVLTELNKRLSDEIKEWNEKNPK